MPDPETVPQPEPATQPAPPAPEPDEEPPFDPPDEVPISGTTEVPGTTFGIIRPCSFYDRTTGKRGGVRLGNARVVFYFGAREIVFDALTGDFMPNETGETSD